MINCQFENGNQVSLRHVVVDAICIKDGQILLEKRSQDLLHGGKYAIPGGYLERNETAEQGILRELKEETGYEGNVVKMLKVVDNTNRGDDRQNVCLLFLVEVTEKKNDGDGESLENKWFDLDNLPDKEEFAFDHFDLIKIYISTLK